MATWLEVERHIGNGDTRGAYLPEWKNPDGSKDKFVCNDKPYPNNNRYLTLHDFSRRNETYIDEKTGLRKLLPDHLRFQKHNVPFELQRRDDWILD